MADDDAVDALAGVAEHARVGDLANALADDDAVGALAETVDGLVSSVLAGAIVSRRRGDSAATVAIGIADYTGRTLTPETPMRVGSISKPFVATITMQLVEEEVVDLESPLSTWLPETPVGADRTLEQLLSHRSGLWDAPVLGASGFWSLVGVCAGVSVFDWCLVVE